MALRWSYGAQSHRVETSACAEADRLVEIVPPLKILPIHSDGKYICDKVKATLSANIVPKKTNMVKKFLGDGVTRRSREASPVCSSTRQAVVYETESNHGF